MRSASVPLLESASCLDLVRKALSYADEDAGDIVALNAGAAIYAANIEDSIAAGVRRAQQIMNSGEALRKLEQLAAHTSRFED